MHRRIFIVCLLVFLSIRSVSELGSKHTLHKYMNANAFSFASSISQHTVFYYHGRATVLK